MEIDGAWFGGHIRPEDHRAARIDRRRRQHQNGKRLCVVAMRQRGGPDGNRRRETRGRGRPDHSPARRPWEHRPRGRGEGLGRSARYLRDEAHRSQQGLRCGWRLHQPGRKAISPGSAAPKSASITILPDHILANMPAKWRGAKTCAARQPARGWMSAAAWPLPIRRQGHGQDIGSAISGKRSFVKPPDRRSARGCHGLCHQMRGEAALFEAVQSVSHLPLDTGETGAIGRVEAFAHHHVPDDVWCADRHSRPADGIEHATREFPLLKPAIGLPDSLCGNSLRFQFRSEQADGRVEMHEIGTKLTKVLLCTGNNASDLGPLRDQCRYHVAFRHKLARSRKTRDQLSPASLQRVSPALGVAAPRYRD